MAVVSTMGSERKSARMQDQIKLLLDQGLSIRKVALALSVSRQTVRKFGDSQETDDIESEFRAEFLGTRPSTGRLSQKLR